MLSSDKSVVKICDFGVSRIKASKQASMTVTSLTTGTESMAAPEILLQKVRSNRATDLWSLGGTLVELFVQCEPWNVEQAGDQALGEYLKSLMRAKLLPHNLFALEQFNRDVHSKVKQLFDYAPEKRPSAEALCKFFSGEEEGN